MDRSVFDFVGLGALNPADQVKVPPCGACHPGGAGMEYARDTVTGQASAVRLDQVAAATYADSDGDFRVAVGANKADFVAAFPNPFAATGVVEGDCLLCHLSGYNFGARFKQLTYRNYGWASTVAAGLGTVGQKVYTFDDTTSTGFKSGTWVTSPAALPTVDYAAGLASGKVIDAAGQYRLAGASLNGTPAAGVCRFCHSGADMKKRGFEWSAAEDVHNAAGLECLDCHGMAGNALDHNIGKGHARLGSVRNDLDGTIAHGCGDCHSAAGSAANPAAAHASALDGLGFHFDRISCETCHIPYKNYTAGELIDMSSGNQVWYLSDGKTIKWAGDFDGNAYRWMPFNKPYDPDGDGRSKLYPYAAKTSAWFGYVPPGKQTVQPYILRHVNAAYTAATAQPKVPVTYVKDDSTLMKPSVSATADVVAMLEYLRDNGPYGDVTPVFVAAEVAYRLDSSGSIEATTFANAETDHNFSVSHNVRAATEALGANGCADCHAEGAGLFATMQVTDASGYLKNSYRDKTNTAYAEPVSELQGYSHEAAERLTTVVDPNNLHATLVSYAANGANTCAQCHPDQVAEFKDTVHYASRSVVENENFFFPGGGKHGMLDRACALVGSNMLLNMLTTGYVDLADVDATTGDPAQQCGGCHTNYYLTLMEPMLAQQMGDAAAEQVMLSGVDCLICHAEDYDMRLRKTLEVDPYGLNAGFGTVNGQAQRVAQDRSGAALDSIQPKPTDAMCLRCHEHGRTDYKRGELPEPDHDIHYELGVSADNPCTFCHEVTNHKFNRGAMVNGDIFASDYPVNSDENSAACLNCHTDWPHSSDRLNSHVAKLACETCHITYTAGAETTIWADGGFLALAKGTDNRPVKLYSKKEDDNNLTAEELWETYKQRPIYMPFSGLTSFLAQSVPITNNNPMMTGGAAIEPKIFPFKTIINPLPFDGRFFGVGVESVDRDGDGINDYSMFAAMKMFELQYKALGFMDTNFDFDAFRVDGATGMVVTTWPATDPAFPSYAAMAQMAAFPNMLFFDKYTFGHNWYQDLGELADPNGDGDTSDSKIQLWDADYRPLAVKDMRKAVEVGMTRLIDMMVQMGFQPPAGVTIDMMKGMYGKHDPATNPYGFTDDQLVVMAAPPGSEMQLMLQQMKDAGLADISDTLIQNYPAWSNGVTLGGHGVRRDQALFCADCHTTEAGANVFDQMVEVPSYGANGRPLMQWMFYSKQLIDLAEAGQVVADVEQSGYTVAGTPFEMGGTFRTASQDAAALGITYGLEGDYLAMLTPVTHLVSNWKVLGYTDERIAELTNRTAAGGSGGSQTSDVGTDVTGSSECFVQTLGGGAGVGSWLAGLIAALAALGVSRRP